MGVNVASRKRRNVGQDDEAAWAGTIVLTSEGRVVVCVSDEKWEKLRLLCCGLSRSPLQEQLTSKNWRR